ncbi:MAG TPA: PhzF family phenazine biosynthesis protein [Gemmataceae bacterium]|jgi:PhzF family phenazine biosynthesis protein|nr:PhzF family phenazine biosynthesis protein [Gemmataceae bacterium]
MIPLFTVDSFTSKAFAGNPAAVCFPPGPKPDAWLHDVAREMNLSETAFLWSEGDGFRLRWLTPTVEVDLCGHATLASAHILWQTGRLKPDAQARFQSRSGLLTATKKGEWMELNFPAKPPEEAAPPPQLLDALGTKAQWVGSNRMDYFALVESEEEVRRLRPDFAALKGVSARGIIVTARSADSDFDFVSRFFAPGSGIDEDPVTGSAHCCLAPFWGQRLGKRNMVGFQASARGGVVRVTTEGDRVILGGQAVTILEGMLRLT